MGPLQQAETDDESAIALYDGKMELAVAGFMRSYAAEYRAPPGSRVASDFRRWSSELRCDGQARLSGRARANRHLRAL